MSDGDGWAHASAIRTAILGTGLTRVYIVDVPDNPTLPYVVIFPDAGRALQTSMTYEADQYDQYWQTTSVGRDGEQVIRTAEKVRSGLAGVTLTVSGWNCSPIQHVMSSRVASDFDAPEDYPRKFDEWRYRAVPSS